MRTPKISHFLLVVIAAALLAGCGEEPAPPVAVEPEPPINWDDHTQGLPFVIGYQEGLDQAKSEGKPAMMFATATWCGWCTRLAEENFNDPEVKELLSQFVCVIVNGDAETDALRALGAEQGYPHLVFLSPEGERIGECLGYRPLEEFKPIVEEALAAAESN